MRIQFSSLLAFTSFVVMDTLLFAQQPAAAPQGAQQQAAPATAEAKPQTAKPEDTEVWDPVPKGVTPGANNAAPPPGAMVLLDRKRLDGWGSGQDKPPA